MSEEKPKISPWSQQFLWIMLSLFLIGPVAGAFIFATAGALVGTDEEPAQLAVRGAKIGGLVLGFCAPFIALFAVVRSVKNQSPDSTQVEDSESRGSTDR
ncbi:MAG: hypothetical protein SynsKO_37920 [Synoicihabitans sp.]